MADWLLKTEPDAYSWDDLERDRSTTWDGITNALALKHLRAMVKGDRLLIYHTGDEKQIVGVAQVAAAPHPDPNHADDKRTVVEIAAKKRLKHPVTLAQIKADPTFEGWDLIRISRLSVVSVPAAMWERVFTLSDNGVAPAKSPVAAKSPASASTKSSRRK